MVMDFGFLKECMNKAIYDPCDHGLILTCDDPLLAIMHEMTLPDGHPEPISGFKLEILDCSPTAENLAKHWYDEVKREIQKFFDENPRTMGVHKVPEVKSITVWETPNCYARYPA